MGIIHLAPAGRSPGAVTAPLAYLKRLYDEQSKTGQRLPESVLPRRLGYPVEAIVLFVSDEVRRGCKGATAYDDTIYNQYGSRSPISGRQGICSDGVVDIISDFAGRELSDGKLALYRRVVDVNDFNACFRSIAETALALGRPDDLGKTMWANLTGGTNVLNAALLEVTFLSGLIHSLYYVFVSEDERRFLQPLSTDYRRYLSDHWRNVPVVKTTFDEHYRRLLLMLAESQQEWWSVDALFSQMCNQFPNLFGTMTPELFQKQRLRKLSYEVELDVDAGRVKLTEAGYETVARIEEPLFRTLVQRGEQPQIDIQALRDALEHDRVRD
jgi:hypothetical protein